MGAQNNVDFGNEWMDICIMHMVAHFAHAWIKNDGQVFWQS